jgi:hypothetical protein
MIRLRAALALPSEKMLKAKIENRNLLACFFPRKCEILDSRARFFREGRVGVSLLKDLQIKVNSFF